MIERPAKNARITDLLGTSGRGDRQEAAKTSRTSSANWASSSGVPVAVNIEEVRKPEIDASADRRQHHAAARKRIMFRRAMKRAMQNAMRLGAQGIKIMSVGPPERHRNRAYRVVPRRSRAASHADAPTSTTAPRKPRPPTASSASRSGSTRATRWAATTCRPSRPPRPEEERRPRGPRRDGRPGGDRPGGDRRGPGPRAGARGPIGGNTAPADGSDKPAEATGGAGADSKPAVKRRPQSRARCRS